MEKIYRDVKFKMQAYKCDATFANNINRGISTMLFHLCFLMRLQPMAAKKKKNYYRPIKHIYY